MTDKLSIIHLSDLHFGREDPEAIRETEAHIHQGIYDLILVSGDITQSGKRSEFESAATWLAGLPGPKLVTVGNHDFPVFNLFERVREPFKRFLALVHGDPTMHIHRYFHPLCRFATLRTAHALQWRKNWSLGAVKTQHLRRTLQDVLPGEEPWRIVMGHHPLHDNLGGGRTIGSVWGGHKALRALYDADVDLVLSGHIHTPFFVPKDPERGLPATAGTGTVSTRLREAPPGFNRMVISPRELVIESVEIGGATQELARLKK